MNTGQELSKLLEDMRLRGFSLSTIAKYTLTVSEFIQYCHAEDLATLDEGNFRDYLIQLHGSGNLNPSTINQCNSAIQFLYEVTLGKDINYKRIP